MAAYTKPLPPPNYLTRQFWEGCKAHKLLIQRCTVCNTPSFSPRDACPGPDCLEYGTLAWEEASGRGRVIGFTIVRQPADPRFAADVPYVLAVIELNERVRLNANVVGCAPEAVRVGMPVEVVFDDVTPEFTLYRFRPLAS